MKIANLATAVLVAAFLMMDVAPPVAAEARIQFPKAEKVNANEKTLNEFRNFYDQIEDALAAEDIDRIMGFYAEEYLHHGITKKQLKFMWLEIFSNYDELYSVHIFTKVDAHGADAPLLCTGGLFGIAEPGEDYQAIDRWANQNHWVTKIDGEWKMIGGATHQAAKKGSKMELHPLF